MGIKYKTVQSAVDLINKTRQTHNMSLKQMPNYNDYNAVVKKQYEDAYTQKVRSKTIESYNDIIKQISDAMLQMDSYVRTKRFPLAHYKSEEVKDKEHDNDATRLKNEVRRIALTNREDTYGVRSSLANNIAATIMQMSGQKFPTHEIRHFLNVGDIETASRIIDLAQIQKAKRHDAVVKGGDDASFKEYQKEVSEYDKVVSEMYDAVGISEVIKEREKLQIARDIAQSHIKQIEQGWEVSDRVWEGDVQQLVDEE